MISKINNIIKRLPAANVEAHCDGPCGVYDPASARIAGEAVLSMTKKLLDLKMPEGDSKAQLEFKNKLIRYTLIKEEQAQDCKEQLLILWTDYFKPVHLESNPKLHEVFWNAAKLCSTCKVEVSLEHANELMDAIKQVHEIFWKTKNRDVPWVLAS